MRNGMYRKGELTLEQSAESRRAVGMNGFPHRYQRGDISLRDVESGQFTVNWSGTAEFVASSSMEDGAFLYLFSLSDMRRNKINETN